MISATSEHLKSSGDPNYILWGLHFSSINNTKTTKENRSEVLRQLGTSFAMWYEKFVKKEGAKEILASFVDDIKRLTTEIILENIPATMLKKASQAVTPPLKKTKIGRNDPCPCRSGKKYKNCHGS